MPYFEAVTQYSIGAGSPWPPLIVGRKGAGCGMQFDESGLMSGSWARVRTVKN
jgi:hypothetical protein